MEDLASLSEEEEEERVRRKNRVPRNRKNMAVPLFETLNLLVLFFFILEKLVMSLALIFDYDA